MPTHCSFVDLTGGNGQQANRIVPVTQDPPAPNIMNPAVQSGLYNPDKYVRGGAVEAMGKTYGVAAMKKAEREERDAKARMQHHASDEADVPTRSGTLTDEQRALFDELVDKVKLGEAGEWETAPVEEHEAQGGPPGPEREAPKPRVEKPAAKQKKKQPQPAPLGTAWFLQRGKELDRERTY